MLLGNKRSDLEVVADILQIEGSQTAIMYGANLSYSQTRKYLQLLGERQLIELVTQGVRYHYRPTAKGRKLMELLQVMQELVGVPLPEPTYPKHVVQVSARGEQS